MIGLGIKCDVPGCDASHVWAGSDDVAVGSSELDDERGGMFYVDSGWEDPPDGWQLTKDGERCPDHRELVA